jgi:hypothetical protein
MKSLIKNGITMLCLAVIIAVALPAHAKKDEDKNKGTIFETLERTDGSQALVAAIRYVDGPDVDCNVQIELLLDDKKKKAVFFAPSNRGFERYLKLPEGGFDGMDAEAIKLAFSGILNKLTLTGEDICDMLQMHVAPTKDAKKLTVKKLLQQGSITVADGDLFPIAIGEVGASISYAANITERDVFTVNGVIHYIDNVLVEPPPPSDDTTPLPNPEYCEELSCGTQEGECVNFVAACNASMQGRDDCAAGATLICIEIDLGDPG